MASVAGACAAGLGAAQRRRLMTMPVPVPAACPTARDAPRVAEGFARPLRVPKLPLGAFRLQGTDLRPSCRQLHGHESA